MSVEAMAQTAPEQPQPEVASESASKDTAKPKDSPKPTGLHSPPDSNSAMKLDGSDDESELSELDESDPAIGLDQPPSPFNYLATHDGPVKSEDDAAAKEAEEEEDEAEEEDDIGDITPAEWSGTVPVFKPDMHQFKDFKKFVGAPSGPSVLPRCVAVRHADPALSYADEQDRLLWYEVGYCQGCPPPRVEGPPSGVA